MKFMVTAWDVPGEAGLNLRNALRAADTDTIAARYRQGMVLMGAGIYDEAGVVRGSVIIMDCESRAGIDSYLETEPFQTGGLWERVEVREIMVPDMYLEPRRPARG